MGQDFEMVDQEGVEQSWLRENLEFGSKSSAWGYTAGRGPSSLGEVLAHSKRVQDCCGAVWVAGSKG